MASLKHRIVKDDKANAITTFQTKRKLETIFHLFNVFAALFLFSRSSLFPIILQAFSYSLAVLLPLFNNPFYVFLLLNSIILSLYALSNKNGTSGNSKDTYDEFLSNSNFLTVHVPVNVPRESAPPEKQTVTTVVDSKEKPVMHSEVGESPVFSGTLTAVTTTTHQNTSTTTCCTTTTTCGVDNVSEKKCYRRFRSESYERRVVVGGGPELRRMSTGLSRQLQGRMCHVEQLNKEDFNRAVEDFIAKHKRMLREEQRKSHKTEYLALK